MILLIKLIFLNENQEINPIINLLINLKCDEISNIVQKINK